MNEGVGGVKLALDPKEVIRAIGAKPAKVHRNADGATTSPVFAGPEVGQDTTVIFDSRERAAEIVTYNPALRTDLGHVGVGSTRGAVQRAFSGGKWLGGPVPIYSLGVTAANGDTISNLFDFTRTGKVKLVAIVDKTTVPRLRP